MLILTISLQILVVVIALLVATLDYLWHDKRTKKFKRARATLFVLSVVFLILSIVGTILNEREKAEEISDLKTKLTNINNNLTGGNGYCFLMFTFPARENDLIDISLRNPGEYPLYDIQIRMVDLNKFNELNWKVPMPESEIRKTESIMNLAVLGPKLIMKMGSIKTPPEACKYGFNIWIHTRYKELVQQARFRRFKGRWRIAYRLYDQTHSPENPILEKVSKEFENIPADQIWTD